MFGRADNAVTVLAADGSVTELPHGSKDAVAAGIWSGVAARPVLRYPAARHRRRAAVRSWRLSR